MKRLFIFMLLLPSLGACTLGNDYYAGNGYYGNEYSYPSATASVTQYQNQPRAQVRNNNEQPGSDTRVVVRRPGRQVYRHNRNETNVQQRGGNDTHTQVIQRR